MFSLKNISVVLGLVIAISTIVGIVFNLDSRWAKAAEVKKIEYRLEQKIQQDRVESLQERLWKLEDRYVDITKMPQEVKDEYRRLKSQKEELEKYIDKVVKETKTQKEL